MPRPASFDHDEVLEQAMLAFWTYGYANTSIHDLVEQTDLLRGSLYNAFGDKHALYVQTLQRYGHKSLQQTEDILNAPQPLINNVRSLLMVIVDMTAAEKKRGSMVCNCIAEMVPHDTEVARTITQITNDLKQVLEAALVHAQQTGELKTTVSAKALTRYLVSSIQGLCITAKAGATREELLDIVAATMLAFQ